jgi:hypothetical protein
MRTDLPPVVPEEPPGVDAPSGPGTGGDGRLRSRATGTGRFRQRPPVWSALLMGAFAVGVLAATDGVLRLLAEPAPASAPAATPGGASPGGAPSTTAPPPGDPAPAGATPAPTVPAGGAAPAPASTPAPPAGAANDSAGDETNVDEAAEGPRRAAPARPSDDEAPEFRESADNNISLPVDI